MLAIALENPVDLVIVQRVLEVLVLRVVVEVVVEAGIIDGVHVDVAMGVGEGFPEEGIVPLGVSGVGRVKIL